MSYWHLEDEGRGDGGGGTGRVSLLPLVLTFFLFASFSNTVPQGPLFSKLLQ